MNITIIDFETYFDANFSLKRLSIPEYVHDARFRVHGLAIRWPDGHTEFRRDVREALRELTQRFGPDLAGTVVVGHHLQFDLYILNHRYGIRPRFFVDTMLLAHHIHGRRDGGEGVSVSLGALAERYALDRKKDLEFMSGVRNPDTKQLADLADYARRDVSITHDLAVRLLPELSRPDVELPLMMHTIRLFTERGVRVDMEGIDALEKEVRDELDAAIDRAGVTAEAVSKDGMFAQRLGAVLERTGRSIPTKEGKRGAIPATAKKDAAMLDLLEDDDPDVAALARARATKKGSDQKLARLETLRGIVKATGGVLPPYLVYCGSHTGRFAGGGGFNIQNLGRSGLGGRVRGLLVPRPGHVFIIGDLAQIEARITAWYAGQQDMLAAFAEGRDIYSEFATTTFSQEVRKPRKEDSPDSAARVGPLRQVGKAAVLGLGFGMGALKFMDTLRADPATSALFERGVLSPATCRGIVGTYRETYTQIPQLWRDLEEAVRGAIGGVEKVVAGIGIARKDTTVRLTLPSGRMLRYPRLREEHASRTIKYLDADGSENEFTPEGPGMAYGRDTAIYGGKICENVVQAAARDILVEAILRIEARGLPVLFHVHDEVVVEVPRGEAEEARQMVAAELSKSPEWARSLPVGCEVVVAGAYQK